MRAHDGGVEHLKEMRRGAHGRKRVEECFENAALAQSIEASPHAVPGTKALRQSAPANVLHGEEMKRPRKRRSSSAFRPRRGRQARNTASVCAQSFSSIFVDMDPRP